MENSIQYDKSDRRNKKGILSRCHGKDRENEGDLVIALVYYRENQFMNPCRGSSAFTAAERCKGWFAHDGDQQHIYSFPPFTVQSICSTVFPEHFFDRSNHWPAPPKSEDLGRPGMFFSHTVEKPPFGSCQATIVWHVGGLYLFRSVAEIKRRQFNGGRGWWNDREVQSQIVSVLTSSNIGWTRIVDQLKNLSSKWQFMMISFCKPKQGMWRCKGRQEKTDHLGARAFVVSHGRYFRSLPAVWRTTSPALQMIENEGKGVLASPARGARHRVNG